MYHSEMAKFLKEIKATPSSAKCVKVTKRPYWTEELSIAWKVYLEAEKIYLNTNANAPNLVTVRNTFRDTHNAFTKLHKKTRHTYQ